jgi:hypothetical protein
MLPVYEAIRAVRVMSGGSTRPWLLKVLVEGESESYVVKLFTQSQVDEGFAVANEVFAHVLAKQFDLQCPSAALIQFPDIFYESLTSPQLQEFRSKDNRLKFGCVYIENVNAYTTKANIEIDDVASIYAFDLMIANGDRRIKKPNILIQEPEYFLIDHELSCQITQGHIQYFNEGKVMYRDFSKHIFYERLKHEVSVDPDCFESFGEYLRTLNVSVLDSYSDQLEEHRHPIGDYQLFKEYLRLLKRNHHQFIKNLKTTLQ